MMECEVDGCGWVGVILVEDLGICREIIPDVGCSVVCGSVG